MPLTPDLAAQLRRLSPREKAAVADHLWREVEATLGPTKELRVANILGPQLFKIDADSQLFSGSYDTSQEWSEAFMRHPQKPHGLRRLLIRTGGLS